MKLSKKIWNRHSWWERWEKRKRNKYRLLFLYIGNKNIFNKMLITMKIRWELIAETYAWQNLRVTRRDKYNKRFFWARNLMLWEGKKMVPFKTQAKLRNLQFHLVVLQFFWELLICYSLFSHPPVRNGY